MHKANKRVAQKKKSKQKYDKIFGNPVNLVCVHLRLEINLLGS